MSQPAPRTRLSIADYLASEDGADIRHEYIDGQLYAMTGASDRHGLITGNILAALRPLLRGTPCQIFANDMKVRLNISRQDIFYYPDLLITCDPKDRETYYRDRPCMIIEVLSEATARIDRHEKLLAYQTTPTLMEYLLVSQKVPQVQIYRRDQAWAEEIFTEGSILLACLDYDLPMEVIYEDVHFS